MTGPAELVIIGDVVTLDPRRPRAGGVAIRDGRVLAVGDPADLDGLHGPHTQVAHAGDGCILPGFVEAHGHFVADALGAADGVTDIRPVTVPDAAGVLAALRRAVAARPPHGVLCNGWDPLLQKGLPRPDLAWLDERAPDLPLVILHNSGHVAYCNSAALHRAGLPGGDPDGTVTGPEAIGRVTGALFAHLLGSGFEPAMAAQSARMAARGVTTMSDMGFAPAYRPALQAARKGIDTRLRLYEPATPALTSQTTPGTGDDLIRQIGIKVWADGSPWTGGLAATFPYLDTPAVRGLGLAPGHRAPVRYDHAGLTETFRAYGAAGWQLACHANGDAAIDLVLDVWADLTGGRAPSGPPQLRLEHVSSMRPDQFARAHGLGVTCSLFPDHLHYWGEILADDLFGPEVAERWAPAGTAVRSGMRVSLHNDSPVTPTDPLHNIGVAATRTTRGGRTLGRDERLGVAQALRAQTIDAAWQLLADDVIGSVTPGKYADLVVLSADPLAVAPEDVAGLDVIATYLAGTPVHSGLLERPSPRA
ncbi:amidohydrolase [Actinomadura parmotrematis]|uniref:Amidohydrolase n=1 Tax=Actinomadura parmotrematis TaxID=2864039 RepID=A0ABS7G3A6_9ACTN|nr:amidohydrolase [Actinomadura parmotrematis]MBW8487204.1 amidohydrolase [Actinomadura parmotrematis]